MLPIFLVILDANEGTIFAQNPTLTPAQPLLQNAEVTPEGGVNFYTTFKG